MSSCRFLLTNGILSSVSDTPPVSTFLETHPGAYTTTRTHNNVSCILFWERHMRRLINSAQILYNSKPELLFGSDIYNVLNLSRSMKFSLTEPVVRSLVNASMKNVFPLASKEMNSREELAITMLVSGDLGKLSDFDKCVDEDRISRVLDVHVHVGIYVPSVFGVGDNCARLAVVGCGRDVAAAKYSDWVRLRKPLEKLRCPSTTELLLSNDGDQILEGCLTNFFVVCRRDNNEVDAKYLDDYKSSYSFEIQTSPISDGVLPGVVRQLIIELCSRKGIPFREIAPSWSQRDIWEEAFITNSLRLLQHVETIRVPKSWDMLNSKTWKDISWEKNRFQDCPGMITTMIQQVIMENLASEGFHVTLNK